MKAKVMYVSNESIRVLVSEHFDAKYNFLCGTYDAQP